MHGEGVYTWPWEVEREDCGDFGKGKLVYDGEWKNGEKHGRGTIINQNGEKREGIWENGKRIKWI